MGRAAVSALALRQDGVLNAAGVPSRKLSEFMIQDHHNILGRKMNVGTANLEEATQQFNRSALTILKASDDLHAQMDVLSKKAKDSVGRAKDMAGQMTDAMNKITKLTGPDFEKRLVQLQQLTECLERLSALQDAGKLQPLLAALSNQTKV